MEPKSVLIVRTAAMGDIVMATSLACALRRTWLDTRICWLVEPEWQTILSDHPAVDEVLTWPGEEWRDMIKRGRLLSLRRAISEFRQRLRSYDFDLGIDAQGTRRSAWSLWLADAKHRIGLGSQERVQRFLHQVVSPGDDDIEIGGEYRCIAKALALDCGDFRPGLAIGDALNARVDALRVDADLALPYLVFCPFSERVQKRWPEAYWSALLRGLHAATDKRIVILGEAGDRDSARRIIDNADELGRKAARNLAGHTSLEEAMGLIARSQLVVSIDVGLGHMGIAFNRPTIMLFGSTRPYTNPTRDNARVLFHDMACAPCGLEPTCDGAYTCMKELDVQLVAGHALRRME